MPAILALLLSMSSAASVESRQRFDHRGALGLLLGTAGMRKESSQFLENTWRAAFDVGASFNIGYGSGEVVTMLRVSVAEGFLPSTNRFGPVVDGQTWVGYRGYFGDRFKTFFDLDLALSVVPGFTVGPRVALGAQYELTSVSGLFTSVGVQLGFGSALVFRAELGLGIQLRTYVFE